MPPQFALLGGHPALDFLNTIHDWTVPEPRDYLPGFPDVLRFATAAGVLSRSESRRLAERAAGGELARLRALRARLERILRAVEGRRSPAAADLEALAREAAEAARRVGLRASQGGLVRRIEVHEAGPAVVRLRLVEAAVALLTSARVQRLKACPGCGWFFLDSSKNRSRRWCSMTMCGGSAKARRYYWRKKGRGTRDEARGTST